MNARLATLAVVLTAAIGAPLVVSAAGTAAPAAKAPAPVVLAAVSAPAPAPIQAAPAQAATATVADCGRRVRVVYQGYAAAPVACTASR